LAEFEAAGALIPPDPMGKRTKILILADSPLPALRQGAMGRGAGQGATWLPPLAQAFAAHEDLDITWAALGEPGTPAADEQRESQRFIVRPHVKAARDTLTGYALARWRLKKIVHEVQPDVVHCWGSERYYPSVLRGLKVPSVLSIQGNLTRYAEIGGLTDIWFWRRQWRYEGKWVPHATVVACESPWSREVALGYWPEIDARVIEWGVHPSFYEVEWHPRLDGPYLLFSGGLEWRKGLDVLFDALAAIPERRWSVRLAGEGPMRAELEARKLPGVEWLGNLKWDELKRQMAGASALVMPTRADTGPSVVKEARVMGLPVIASVNGGLRDYIAHGENGLHVDPLTPENLAAAMVGVIAADPGRLRSLGLQRLEADRAYFHPRRAAASFHDLYRELAR
jgi:glycosyltransferase involved in cell wall biosynthesis